MIPSLTLVFCTHTACWAQRARTGLSIWHLEDLILMSNQIDLIDPRLPPELEHKIFEIAALVRPKCIPVFMLVSRRVKCWVEPLLYRVVFLHAQRDQDVQQFGLPIFSAHAPERKSHHLFSRVRTLFISASIGQRAVKSWLLACPNTTNLYALFDVTPEILPYLTGFTDVRRLTIEAAALRGSGAPLPLFLSVTHLELLDSPHDVVGRVCKNLALMPKLTHIALNPQLPSRLSHAELCANAQLQCIVFLSAKTSLNASPLRDDPRFVCIRETRDYFLDWLQGAISGDNYWSVADTFLAAKRSGKIDRSCYHISNEGHGNYTILLNVGFEVPPP